MDRDSAKVCPVCYEVQHKCTCRCPRCSKTLPDCKCPAESSAWPPPPPPENLDPFVQTVMMAYNDPVNHKTWIGALTAKELGRRMAGTPSPYSKALQPYVDALVKHAMQQLVAPLRLEQQAELQKLQTRLQARPPRPHTAPRALAPPPAGQVAVHSPYVRKQFLAAYHILPELIDGLTDFVTVWRSSTEPVTKRCGTPESFSLFLSAVTQLNQTVFRKPRFFTGVKDGLGQWTSFPRDQDAAAVYSPYFPADDLQPSQRGSPSGSNTWLDRFLHARSRFRNATQPVVLHPYFKAATQDSDSLPHRIPQLHEFPAQLVADLTALKFEFAALVALCLCPLTLPVPDFSLDGRDPNSKWFASGGGFRLWTSDTAHEHLSDPQQLCANLRGLNELRFVGRTLADLPGAFPDVEARINITTARLRKKQIDALALTISDTKTNPMRDMKRAAMPASDRFEQQRQAREESRLKDNLEADEDVIQAGMDYTAVNSAGMSQAQMDRRLQDNLEADEDVIQAVMHYTAVNSAGMSQAQMDRRLQDNLEADEDVMQAGMDYTAVNSAGMSQAQMDRIPYYEGAVKAIIDRAGVPNTFENYPLEAGWSRRAAGSSEEYPVEAGWSTRSRRGWTTRDAASSARAAASSEEYTLEDPSSTRAAGSSTRRYPLNQQSVHRRNMAAATVDDVQYFNSYDINVALEVRGIKIPTAMQLLVAQRRLLLRALLSGKTVAEVIQAFADQGVPLMRKDGQWLVYRRRK